MHHYFVASAVFPARCQTQLEAGVGMARVQVSDRRNVASPDRQGAVLVEPASIAENWGDSVIADWLGVTGTWLQHRL